MTRQRGVMVEVLDYERLTAACKEHGLGTLSFGGNALLKRETDGAYVVVSYEGVCEAKITPGMVYLDTMANVWQCLPVDAVLACRTGDTKDLADHIRTFGSRLDVNHWTWYQWAKGER